MFKVMIADDEERICQLITALVDWDALQMEITGIAHNGLEAMRIAVRQQPDILITDIQMPGCSGLDLIKQVKKSVPELEIIIISGYAHFAYAQSAIKYGVGDYLLKPVSRIELNETLRKLKTRIAERRETESDRIQLLQQSESDTRRIRMSLIGQLISGKLKEPSLGILESEYYLKVRPGIFQAFCVKIDGDMSQFSDSGMAILLDETENLLERSLRPRCFEMLLHRQRTACIGILNYENKQAEEIRRLLRECLNQLEARKNLYGPVTFSMAVGSMADAPQQLGVSVREVSIIIQERLVKGTGRMLDRMPANATLHERNLLEKYARLITHAIEIMSIEEGTAAVEVLRTGIEGGRTASGYEILELVVSCGRLFLSQVEMQRREEEIRDFEERCTQRGSVRELLDCLEELQKTWLEQIRRKRENDTLRPVRLAKQYIRNHFSEQITMEEVSSVAGLSTAYFSVLFKKAEGEGFARYLIHVRMEAAKTLLRESQYTVAEICRKVGYNDLKHFTRTFEKVTGVKPATYRKLYG